ncbi:MAG: ABC transporter ATP-binding protein [Geodermatophilaceae bacterium]|nr:ABC transporter ATP-binding protein [Geodermatophilaceae bacterium]
MTTATQRRPDLKPLPPDDHAITVDGLTKAYSGRQVLDGLSLHVGHGEIFGILGPNGTGKTTAVEIIQGLRRRDSGKVHILGLDPAKDQARLRHLLGAQLQSSELPERLKVGEALRLFARLAGDIVDWHELRDEWDLGRLERTAFGALSGGERQRLFVALALVNRPRVVFLDELTQGLDPAARRETWRLVRRVREQGSTVVLVTHYMDEAEQLCDRVGVLSGGRLRACGTPDELIASVGGSYRTRFSCTQTSALAGLDGLPGVHSVTHDGDAVEILGDSSSGVLVAAELVRRGVIPTDFLVSGPSLEDVFVSLTEGAAR